MKARRAFIFVKMVLKISVPVTLLWFILKRLDMGLVLDYMLEINTGYFVVGLVLGIFSQMFIGAYRWRYILHNLYSINIRYSYLLKHYWIGMFLGYFVPAGVAWDFYRITRIYQVSRSLSANVVAVLVEKIVGLIACLSLIAVTYPFLLDNIVASEQAHIANYVYIVTVCCLVMISLVVLIKKTVRKWIELSERIVLRMVQNVINKAGRREIPREEGTVSQLIRDFMNPKPLLVVFVLSVSIRLSASLGAYLFLLSIGQEVPIIVNVFAISLMFIIFLLPISFGSVGVREGSFILLYGLFGISEEVALAASFVGLAALIITVCFGGGILLIDNMRVGQDWALTATLFSRDRKPKTRG